MPCFNKPDIIYILVTQTAYTEALKGDNTQKSYTYVCNKANLLIGDASQRFAGGRGNRAHRG
jgi:hypothetical protein